MLKVENVSKKFGEQIAVEDLSFELEDGGLLALIGTNGAGKTTAFRMILGIMQADSGTITLDNKPITLKDRPKLGFMPEERSLLVKLTVYKQLKFFAELKGMDKKVINQEIDYWLKRLNIEEHKHKVIRTLSKGNQQKVQFIASIIHKPELLILDEPFSGLDLVNMSLIADIIRSLRKNNTKVIFSSHRLDYIDRFAKDVIILNKGKCVLKGNIQEIKKDRTKHKVTIKTPDEILGIKTLNYINDLQYKNDEYQMYLNEYDDIDRLFTYIKDYRIHGFDVSLPSLEDILIDLVGADNVQF